jgi:DNA-binding response OmpR family regulator
MHVDEPIPPDELAQRVSPYDKTITSDDIRRSVYRLRKLIGDGRRHPPLIHNRRGFGYVLEAHGATEPEA